MTRAEDEREDYWSAFYADTRDIALLQPPSQFAAFVAQEIEPGSAVFDVGCGNGRDSLFFATLGFKVVALDQSRNAIDVVKAKAQERAEKNLHCVLGGILDPELDSALSLLDSKNACVYARFFLHAITEDEQDHFFRTLAERLSPGHKVAVEYRTLEDRFLEKTAPPHYRRYQRSEDVNATLQQLGFALLYEIEGQGFAKYQDEDAIVARGLFEKI